MSKRTTIMGKQGTKGQAKAHDRASNQAKREGKTDRQPISSIIREYGGRQYHFRVPDPAKNEFERLAHQHEQLLLCSHYGKVIAMIGRDDIFDHNGNRFAGDV